MLPQPASQDLTIRRLLEFKRITDVSAAPDGRHVAATVLTTDLDQNKDQSQIWFFDRDGEGRPLSPAGEPFVQPRISPDGGRLACLKDNQIHVMTLPSGEMQRVVDIPTGVTHFKWSRDGQSLVFATRIWRDLESWDAQRQRLVERASGKRSSALVYDHAPVLDWDRFIDDRESHVFILQLADRSIRPVTVLTDRQLPRWTGGPFATFDYDISPDGQYLAFVADAGPNTGRRYDQVMLLEIGSSQPRNVSRDAGASDCAPQFSPDGKHLAFSRISSDKFWALHRKIVYRTLDGNQDLHVLNPDWDRSIRAVRWNADSQGFKGIVEDGGIERLYHVPLLGEPEALTHEGSILAYDLARDPGASTIFAVRSGFTEVPTLVRIDADSSPVRLPLPIHSEGDAGIRWGTYESVTYRGADDREIQMWVHYPAGFDPQKKYPLLVMIHGGPFAQASDRMSFLLPLQVYAAAGFIVAYPNFHGSTGFGLEFTRSIADDYASKPYLDVIRATDFMAEKAWVDSERMVAAGASYGGYLSLILLGREHPFKALINMCGLFNLFSQYGSDYAFMGPVYDDYWENLPQFLSHSPHMAVENFKTPILIGHGLLDQRVPINHAMELFHILQQRGVPSRLICYPDENHWFLKPQNNVYWNDTMMAWMRTHAGLEG